ncbi:hypothetical protein [Paraburkholderia sp. Ac-20347]|uniref:hypothetical protein n=1 Tax=Paraburkholderia sp. Ac-20347 TaxID=2703892 RepID=UPI00197EF3F9|nr:hypothetical protein [Paraburkholderia sp. Ac-20347]MBN3809432.1 hypothetical protein [Paraburkholderia sp. Ac-20347]
MEKLGGPSKAARLFGYSAPSFLSQMLKGDRPVTEKTARRMERMIGLPIGWLDENWESPEALQKDLSERNTIDDVRAFFDDDKLPPGVTFADYHESLKAARDEEYSEPEDWPEYGRKVPLRLPSGRILPRRLTPGEAELGPIGLRIGFNTTGKSGAVLNVLRWTEAAASIVKEQLDTHEDLHIVDDKAALLVQTIADLLMATEGSIDRKVIRNIIRLAGEIRSSS